MDIDILLYEFQKKWWPLCSPCSPRPIMFNLMGNCCSWVSKIQQPVRKVSVLLVGLDKAGKTSSVRGMLKVPCGEVGPTVGCVRTEMRVDNFLVSLLDVGGAPESRGTWRDHYGEVHGVIFVVDSSDRQRIKEVKELLADLLRQPRVAGKPLLVLANKQDKMNALVGSELIESLSLEKLVNQSRSLCHVEPCSAMMDLRRWSDKKSLRGLRWLLRAVYLDYPELCARVSNDSKRPVAQEENNKRGKVERNRSKPKEERKHRESPSSREGRKRKERKTGTTLKPIQNMLQKENTLKKKLKKKTKQVKIKETETEKDEENGAEEEAETNEGDQEPPGQKERVNRALITPKRGKLKSKVKVIEKTLDVHAPLDNEDKTTKGKGEKKKMKKKVVKVKRKNKINTEELTARHSQPADLSATFDLYRKAILALKERQAQGQ